MLCEEVKEKIGFRDNLLDLFCNNSLIDKIAKLANSRAHSSHGSGRHRPSPLLELDLTAHDTEY